MTTRDYQWFCAGAVVNTIVFICLLQLFQVCAGG